MGAYVENMTTEEWAWVLILSWSNAVMEEEYVRQRKEVDCTGHQGIEALIWQC